MNTNSKKIKHFGGLAIAGIAALTLLGSVGVNALTSDTTAGSTTPAPTPTPTPSTDLAGLELAKAVALADAGLTEAQVTFKELEAEKEDGTVVYEVEFVYNGTEFEYKITATGTILKSESEVEETEVEGDRQDDQHPAEYVDGDTQDHHAEPADDHHDQHRD
jgi:hypothetical protein